MHILALLLAVPALHAQPAEKDVILRAMKDELARSRMLRVVDAPPYFIEYSLDDSEIYYVHGSFGALMTERVSRLRQPRVRLRVGDPKLDNSNHIFSDAFRGSRYDPAQFPIDDNYDTLRFGFWLATDRAYKQALEALARKKASLRNMSVPADLADFSAAPAVDLVLPGQRKPIDAAAWKLRVKQVSAVCANYEQILSCDVGAGISQTISYLVNSEGSQIRYPDHIASFRIRAQGLASDGTTVRAYAEFHAHEPENLPQAEFLRAVQQVAETVVALSTAPPADQYTGPVLFEGPAAGQLLAELLGRNLSIFRRPVTDPDRPLNLPSGELEGRLGARILPDWIDVADDPTQKEWRGRPLLGHYLVDSEAVPPKPLSVVEKGILKAFYTTRQPVAGMEGSNGHARLPGALGNHNATAGCLFVRAGQTATSADLRKRLLDMGRQRNKPFVLVVRKMDFPSTATFDELRRIGGSQSGRAVSIPLLMYKVFQDGREELVRGVRFRGLSVRFLKDILAASDELFLFQYLENGAPFAHMEAGGYVAPVSVVAPSLLFEDLELERIPGEVPRPPVVPPPPLVTTRE